MRFTADDLYRLVGDDEDGSVCADISDTACESQPQSFSLQLLVQIATKCADTLGSSRVVLPWLLSSIGAPAFFIAWLVPVRESLSMLPQLAIAAQLRRRPRRKYVYVLGALIQGLCMLALPLTLLLPSATLSAAAILLALALFSTARGLCSVASKDVLGKTVARGRRGRLSGIAGSVAGVFTVAFAAFLYLSDGEATLNVLLAMLIFAGLLWLSAAALYAQIPEQRGATEGGRSALELARHSVSLLLSEASLRAFVVARMLLVATAYAIPFLVAMTFERQSDRLGVLAIILFAEGVAALSASTLWGIFADRAPQRVMAASGFIAAANLGAFLLLAPAAAGSALGLLATGLLLYVAAVAHQGTRLGRKTYLVDIATPDNRASYVALSNTVLGIFMLFGGALGWLAQWAGHDAVLLVLLLMAVAGGWRSWVLPYPSD